MEITREQVRQLYKNSQNGSNQLVEADLKNWFPDAFGIEVGKWYKIPDTKGLCFITDALDSNRCFGYGFGRNSGKWMSESDIAESGMSSWNTTGFVPATTEEVYTALVAEAKKRGFDGTKRIEWKFNRAKYGISRPDLSDFKLRNDVLTFAEGVVFRDGEWAEIITRPLTVEERLTKLESRWTEEH